MIKIFAVKQVPRLAWSSPTPFNLRPRFATFFYLNLGLVLFGLGESLLIASGAGVSPWTVLAQGIAGKTGWSIGFTTMIVSFAILFLWIPLKQKPGMGTILNALIIAFMIDFSLTLLPYPQTYIWQVIQAAFGVLVVGIASGIYLAANLGAGPRDGLMTGFASCNWLANRQYPHSNGGYRCGDWLVPRRCSRCRHGDFCAGCRALCSAWDTFCEEVPLNALVPGMPPCREKNLNHNKAIKTGNHFKLPIYR